MSSEQGPRMAGMGASANDAGVRHMNFWSIAGRKEAES
jgi:hypothetical protein